MYIYQNVIEHLFLVNLDNDIIETESTVQFNEPSERSSADVAINESQMPKNFINIRLKYLNDTLRIVQSSPQESIADFKRWVPYKCCCT